MKVLYLILCVIFIFLSVGCESTPRTEESQETTVEETTVEETIEDSLDGTIQLDSSMVEEIYCCTNHEPIHCGNAKEISKLAERGCTGF